MIIEVLKSFFIIFLFYLYLFVLLFAHTQILGNIDIEHNSFIQNFFHENTGCTSLKQGGQYFKRGGSFSTRHHRHPQLDESILDVPRKFLCDILEEEIKSDFVNIYDDQSYKGGTIKSFK